MTALVVQRRLPSGDEISGTVGERSSFPVTIGEATSDPGRRIVVLDGLRGLLTISVMLSHYFGEVPHGFHFAMCGWVAVDMFFILSGFLIGKLILERHHHGNFFLVFYVRRFLRIIPVYFIVVLAAGVIIYYFSRPWMEVGNFPLWSYLSFTQIFYMIATQSIGAHWLAPTWTMSVEEHFYLVAPALIAFTPRRWLVPVLVSGGVFSFFLRLFIFATGDGTMAGFVLLPARADTLICGMLAAIAMQSAALQWEQIIPFIRVIPGVAIIAVAAIAVVTMNGNMTAFYIVNPSLIAVGGSAYILCVVLGALNGINYSSKALRFFGNNGLCIYLVHLPVLGLMHGLILGGTPDIATPVQCLVTIASLAVTVALSRGLTKLVEEPLSAYGRTWRWSAPRSGSRKIGAGQIDHQVV